MTDYQLTAGDTIIRTADGTNIPPDPANRDYVEYQKWLEAGGVPDPYVPPEPVPHVTDQQQTAVLFNHENRLRAAAGDPPLTLADFISKANSL